ncbi:MAG: PAS domain-containing protein [Desulfuromusa sp.]|nr:PAS domain-containing protein [Desulfuromusa sp.]
MSDQMSEPNHSLDEFYDQLQGTVIEQARRLINHNLYTKAILSTLPIALVATDRSGHIRSINRAAEDLLGLGSLGENASLVTCFPLINLDKLSQITGVTIVTKICAVLFLFTNAGLTPSPLMIYFAGIGDGGMAVALLITYIIFQKENFPPAAPERGDV